MQFIFILFFIDLDYRVTSYNSSTSERILKLLFKLEINSLANLENPTNIKMMQT